MRLEVKSLDHYTDSSYKDFYVWTTDGKCFQVKSLFIEQHHLSCEAFEIELPGNLCTTYVGQQLPIDHIHRARLTNRRLWFDAQTICYSEK